MAATTIAAVAALATALTPVTVQATRMFPVDESEMPKCLVYTTMDTVDQAGSTLAGLLRMLELVVDVIVATTASDIDNQLDAYAVIVENAILNNRFSFLARRTRMKSSMLTIRDTDALTCGILTVTFEIDYRTSYADPTIAT